MRVLWTQVNAVFTRLLGVPRLPFKNRTMKKKRLSKVCRGFGMPVPEGIRILSLYGRKIVRKPNTKLSRLERAVLTLHTTLFKP